MNTIWNFSAGPAQLPKTVLEKAQSEMLSYDNSGMSVMELSHRGKVFKKIYEETDANLRRLLDIPEDYATLYLQGGASMQFALIPMNLNQLGKAAYVHTGTWAQKAMDEAERVGMEAVEIATSEADSFTKIPEIPNQFSDFDYVHITTNNTIEGTTIYDFPDTSETPLVADMSSNIFSEPIDVTKFGLIYAGAQKNLGIAGLTLVIIRKDLLERVTDLPKIFDYKVYADNDSMYNTPPTYSIYMFNLILQWIDELGGLEAMKKLNEEKAAKFYAYLDQSDLFKPTVFDKDRSLMNIPFVTGMEEVDKAFIDFSEERGIRNIKGHRSVGGMRASIYNAMPLAGVERLIEVMTEFEELRGDGL